MQIIGTFLIIIAALTVLLYLTNFVDKTLHHRKSSYNEREIHDTMRYLNFEEEAIRNVILHLKGELK